MTTPERSQNSDSNRSEVKDGLIFFGGATLLVGAMTGVTVWGMDTASYGDTPQPPAHHSHDYPTPMPAITLECAPQAADCVAPAPTATISVTVSR